MIRIGTIFAYIIRRPGKSSPHILRFFLNISLQKRLEKS
ncbi:hypothetical protein APHNYW_0600 [Anaplasma phagocytophilum str. ApNYW]|nr:hypothetical protein APHNYW_0600 [Anaplasma phagocytophilum str. ApNYW]